MPLDTVPKETVVEFVRESHRIETMFSPIAFSEGNAPYDTRRRRALATRWCGDDARFVVRANRTNIPTFDSGLKSGDPISGPMFPQAWPRPAAS